MLRAVPRKSIRHFSPPFANPRYGEIVSEKVAFLKNFSCMQRVAYGPPQKIWSQVYADDQSIDAPLARNKGVKVLCTLEADLSSIPLEDLDRRKGQDGAMYYVVDYQIESICE